MQTIIIATKLYDHSMQMYHGVAKRYVPPLHLTNCDVVLVSYEVLRSELYHVTNQESYKTLRHPKRFKNIPSPLPALHWWRVRHRKENGVVC